MAKSVVLTLNLLENSHAFLREAVEKALTGSRNIQHWQFAILNLVQSIELSLKAVLKGIHPMLIYDNIDNPKNTVGPMLALQRLENPKLGGLTFSQKDKKRIKRAVEIRNRMTHEDVQLTAEYAAAQFFYLFAFLSDFQHRHLKTKVSDIVPPHSFESFVQIRNLLKQLVLRAEARIAEEHITPEFVWACPNCGEDTFVIHDGADVCYACSHSEAVVECPHCSRLVFEEDLESFFDCLDTDYTEGQTIVHNSFGYKDFSACEECIPKIKEDIENQRSDDEFHRLEEEYYRGDA